MLADKVRSAKGTAGGGGSATYYVAVIYNGLVRVQPFSSASGYGTPYAAAADLPFVQGGVAFTSSGNAVVTGAYGNRVARAWQWSAAGFGTRYTDLTDGAVNYSNTFALHPANNAIITGRDTGPPYIHAYAFSTTTGFGAKFSNPGTTPTGNISGVDFSPDGNAVAAVGVTNNLISVYPWSGSGFGTRYTGPSPNPLDVQTGTQFRVKFSPQSNAIVMCNSANSGPWIAGFPWSHSTGFGTKYANPAVAVPNGLASLAFSPAGDAVAVGCFNSPYIQVYAFSAATGFGTKYANPATLTGGGITAMAFSPVGTEIAFSRLNTNIIYFYRWSGSGFGALVADANTAPTHAVTHVAFGTITA
jgi:WD40 repeat protein